MTERTEAQALLRAMDGNVLRIVRMTLTKLSDEAYYRELPLPCSGIHDRKLAYSHTEGGSRLSKM